MKIPFSKLCPRFTSVQKSQESRVLQYRYTSFPLLTLPRDFPRETIVSISNRCSIKIPFPFRSTPSTGVENGKIVDDHHWTNGYSYKLQNAWILNAERGFDSISRGPDPEQLGEREEVDSGARWRAAMRRVISVEIYWRYDNGRDWSMPCTFHRTWLPVEQPRDRASSESRLSSPRFEAAIPRVSPIESTRISAASRHP